MPTARIFRPRSRSCWRRAADETVAAGCLLACRGTDGLRPQTRRALRPALHARTGQVCRDGRDRCGTAPLCLRHGGFEDLHQRTAQPRTGTRGVWPWDVGRFRRSSSCDHLCPGAVSPDGRGNLLRPAGDRAARQLLYLPLSGLRRHCGQRSAARLRRADAQCRLDDHAGGRPAPARRVPLPGRCADSLCGKRSCNRRPCGLRQVPDENLHEIRYRLRGLVRLPLRRVPGDDRKGDFAGGAPHGGTLRQSGVDQPVGRR